MTGSPSRDTRARGGRLCNQPVRGVVRRCLGGMAALGHGLRMWGTSPRLMLLGAIPAFIVGVLYTAAIVVFILNVDTVSAWITPFAEDWTEPLRTAVRIAADLALVAAVVLVAVISFVAVTLAVGDPFYEKIWRSVEQRIGDAPAEGGESFWRSARRGIGNGLRLFALAVLVGVLTFTGGFIPVIGQSVVPVLAALVGGWVLTLELTGYAFDARLFSLRERRRMLSANRAGTLGFGLLTYLLFLVPFAAVLIMPAAVAGATMLSRDALSANLGRESPAPR